MTKYKKMSKTLKTSADFDEIFKEVQSEGSKQFTGYARKLYKEDEHLKKVGIRLKRQKIPRNILSGMIEKERKRGEKEMREAKEAGIVKANKKKVKKGYSEDNR